MGSVYFYTVLSFCAGIIVVRRLGGNRYAGMRLLPIFRRFRWSGAPLFPFFWCTDQKLPGLNHRYISAKKFVRFICKHIDIWEYASSTTKKCNFFPQPVQTSSWDPALTPSFVCCWISICSNGCEPHGPHNHCMRFLYVVYNKFLHMTRNSKTLFTA